MYCGHCKEPCEFRVEDWGVGDYEFWGFRSSNHEWVVISNCCDAEVYQDPECTRIYNYWDYKHDQGLDSDEYELERRFHL